MEIKISDQPSLDVDEDFTILITHIESPSCFHVTCHCPEFESMQLEMSKYYNENIKSFSNMKDKVQQLYKQVHFACLYEDAWLRGMLTDILQFDATCVEAFLLDIGLTIKVDLVDIQPLEECFCILPPQAYLCHLNGVQPLPKDNGQWSGKAIDFMKTLCHTSCIMNVTDSSTKSLEVCLMTMDSIAVNVQLIEDDLAVLKECCESDPSDKIEISVASSKIISNRVENTVTTKLSLQWNKMLFQEGEEFNCYIVFVESPSMFHIILEKNLCEVLSMVDNMVAVCETDKTKYMSKREILECEGGCYACPFRDEWMRGIIFDPLNNEPDFVLMLLIDVGIRIRYHYSDIQFLNKQFYVLEPQAHPCYLFQIEPPFSSNEQKWSRESKKFMRTVQDTVGSIVVVSIDDDRLGVFLKLNDGSILNHNMVEKGLAVAINNDNCKSLEDPPEEFSEMAPTNDLFDDFVENLQGFSSHHDLELCKNYTGPPNTTCFKGSRCKKLHQLPNKDGWTSKKVPEGRLPRSIMDYPSPNTMVFINVTAIRSCTTFYGHVLYIDETNDSPTKGSNALQKNRQPKELTDMMDLINSERVIKSLVPLSSVPCYNELLLCYVSTQEKWFRAVVVDYDETYIVTVFLVDYGIEYTASFKQMKKLDGIFTQLPYQAIEMSLANAECGCIQSGEPHDGMDNLFDMTINKMMTGFVVSSNTEEVGVVLFDEDFTDVGEVLCQKGLLKMVEFTVQESDVNSDLSDNIVKLSSKYQKRHPQSQEEILFGVKQLGFVPAKP